MRIRLILKEIENMRPLSPTWEDGHRPVEKGNGADTGVAVPGHRCAAHWRTDLRLDHFLRAGQSVQGLDALKRLCTEEVYLLVAFAPVLGGAKPFRRHGVDGLVSVGRPRWFGRGGAGALHLTGDTGHLRKLRLVLMRVSAAAGPC